MTNGMTVMALAIAATAAVTGAAAQPPAPAGGGATDPACELHVWPAERFAAATSGLLLGGLLDAAIHAEKDKGNRTQMASALEPQGQLTALQALDLPKLLGAGPARIVPHEQPLDRKTVNRIATRRAPSASRCYSELIVMDVAYEKRAIYGRSLRTLFMYRDFAAGQSGARTYKAWGGNGLKLFPPKPGEDVTAANQELVTVFTNNFDEFARNAAQATKR